VDPLLAASSLGAALAVGLLVGLERGWRQRALPDGRRVAGLRTFALIGLLGGLLGLHPTSSWPAAAGLVGVALLFAVAFGRASAASGDLSITTAVAGLVTYALGALAVQGHALLALGAAAVVALLLDMKSELHSRVRRIESAELNAILQLGVLTAAVLPLLPDAGYGPWGALNPFRLWLAVVLIAALSLAGHVAVRLRGPQQGLLWTGLVGGVASSTAATLALARTARANPALARPAAAAIVAASGVMFLRMAVVIGLLQPRLSPRLGGYLLLLGAASFAAAAWQWRRLAEPAPPAGVVAADAKVFDLTTALGFGLALAAVALLVRFAKEGLGAAGVYGVAFASGLADVDAILISTIQLGAQGEVPLAVAVNAIGLAVLANMLAKCAMAWSIGGRATGAPVAAGYLAVAATGFLGVATGWP
jgi:uncharacterized membrane protein (DUF4010 family)